MAKAISGVHKEKMGGIRRVFTVPELEEPVGVAELELELKPEVG